MILKNLPLFDTVAFTFAGYMTFVLEHTVGLRIFQLPPDEKTSVRNI